MFDWILQKVFRLKYTDINNEEGQLYLRRYYVYRGKRRPHVYIHHILLSDDDRALHCHPWAFKSFMFWGSYVEVMPSSQLSHYEAVAVVRRGQGHLFPDEVHGEVIHRKFSAPCFLRREDPTEFHRLILEPGKSTWTMVFTGPRVREWGFMLKTGWVEWRKFRKAIMDAMGMGD